MGPGHFGIALAAKPLAPKAPLWTLLIASEALDMVCFGLIALGIESAGISQSDLAKGLRILSPGILYWSHGLFMALVWSAAVGGIVVLLRRGWRAAGVTAGVVFSHWILDFLVHLPDLPLLFAGSPRVGLGLWGSGPGMILSGILEFLLLAGGLVIYLRWRGIVFRKPAAPVEPLR